MTRSELDQIEKYLRVVLGHDEVEVKNPSRKDGPIEVFIGGEFVGTIARDEDDEEDFYFTLPILGDDLKSS